MSLLQMSVSGAVMIFVITVIRALAMDRVPKKTFLLLWYAALARLLIPFSALQHKHLFFMGPKNFTTHSGHRISCLYNRAGYLCRAAARFFRKHNDLGMGRRLGGGHGPLRGCVRRGLLEMLSGISNVPAAGK